MRNGWVVKKPHSRAKGGLAAALWTGTFLALSLPAASALAAPTVVTASGPVTGVTATYAATKYAPAFTINNFLGIPYAAPPLGALRWTPPQPPASWTVPLAATQYGNICPQGFSQLTFGGGNEDCLTVNVQAPTDAVASSKQPVMVWIHGGGLQTGSGLEYDGAGFVREGHVIFVDFNYRLGLLGFFSHPALATENAGHSGNYGIMDQQAVLAWVHTNIANFGGDPNNITIFGESAGGVSTIAQLISPRAPKFKGAIIQSGGYQMIFPTQAQDQSAGQADAAALGCTDGATVLTCLRALPAQTLVDAVTNGVTTAHDSPTVDGFIFPQSPAPAFADGHFARVPIVNGSTRDEDRLLVIETEDLNILLNGNNAPIHTAAGYPAELADAPGAVNIYPLRSYPSADYAFAAYRTDRIHSCPNYILDQLASRYVPLYAYEFADQTWPNGLLPPDPNMLDVGDPHGSELTYLYPYFRTVVLNYPPSNTLFDTAQQQLAATMRASWINFAKYGRPLAPRSVQWSRFVPSVVNVQSLVAPAPQVSTSFNATHHCSDYWVQLLLQWYGLPAGIVH